MLQSNTSTTTKCLIRTLLLLANTSFKHFYYYKILTALNKLKIFSHVAHDNSKRFKLFAGFIEQYLVDKISVTNVSSVLVVTMSSGSPFQSDIVRWKYDSSLCLSYKERCMCCVRLRGGSSMSFIVYIITTVSYTGLSLLFY